MRLLAFQFGVSTAGRTGKMLMFEVSYRLERWATHSWSLTRVPRVLGQALGMPHGVGLETALRAGNCVRCRADLVWSWKHPRGDVPAC